jgi:hypothetical protein
MYLCAKIKRIFDDTLFAVVIADDRDSCARVVKSCSDMIRAMLSLLVK